MNKFFEKLPFKKLAEKIPAGARAKVPLLETIIPFANYIASGIIVLVVVIVVASASGSGGGKSGGKSSGGSAGASSNSPLLSLAEKYYGADLKFWEDKATETDAARASGHIARGKYNLKVTGPISVEELKNIVGAIKNLKGENATQFVRLDLSATTGLQIPQYSNIMFLQSNIGSLVFPDGLEIIGESFSGCPIFEMNPIPSSVKKIDGSAFNTTCLTRLVLPANYEADRPSSFYSSLLPSTVVFSEGHEVADLEGFGDTLIFGNRPVPPITLVFPSTLKEIKCAYGEKDLYTGIDTMYFYGQTPPKVNTKRDMFFKNIKTIYVPSGAVKDYEDAYFSIGNIDVKALPGNRANFSYWMQPVSFDKNAIIKEYKAVAAIGKKNAQERDKAAGEYLQKEANRIFGF